MPKIETGHKKSKSTLCLPDKSKNSTNAFYKLLCKNKFHLDDGFDEFHVKKFLESKNKCFEKMNLIDEIPKLNFDKISKFKTEDNTIKLKHSKHHHKKSHKKISEKIQEKNFKSNKEISKFFINKDDILEFTFRK